MKPLAVLLVCIIATIGCGAGHPNLKSITVNPTNASANVSSEGSVGYSATGIFSDNSSRDLTVGDGLSWRTSDTTIASINDLGMASCNSFGKVTITASAPKNLQLTVNNGISNTADTIRGSAALNCK